MNDIDILARAAKEFGLEGKTYPGRIAYRLDCPRPDPDTLKVFGDFLEERGLAQRPVLLTAWRNFVSEWEQIPMSWTAGDGTVTNTHRDVPKTIVRNEWHLLCLTDPVCPPEVMTAIRKAVEGNAWERPGSKGAFAPTKRRVGVEVRLIAPRKGQFRYFYVGGHKSGTSTNILYRDDGKLFGIQGGIRDVGKTEEEHLPKCSRAFLSAERTLEYRAALEGLGFLLKNASRNYARFFHEGWGVWVTIDPDWGNYASHPTPYPSTKFKSVEEMLTALKPFLEKPNET